MQNLPRTRSAVLFWLILFLWTATYHATAADRADLPAWQITHGTSLIRGENRMGRAVKIDRDTPIECTDYFARKNSSFKMTKEQAQKLLYEKNFRGMLLFDPSDSLVGFVFYSVGKLTLTVRAIESKGWEKELSAWLTTRIDFYHPEIVAKIALKDLSLIGALRKAGFVATGRTSTASHCFLSFTRKASPQKRLSSPLKGYELHALKYAFIQRRFMARENFPAPNKNKLRATLAHDTLDLEEALRSPQTSLQVITHGASTFGYILVKDEGARLDIIEIGTLPGLSISQQSPIYHALIKGAMERILPWHAAPHDGPRSLEINVYANSSLIPILNQLGFSSSILSMEANCEPVLESDQGGSAFKFSYTNHSGV